MSSRSERSSSATLKKAGHEVHAVENGKEALKLLEESERAEDFAPFHLLISDLRMPEMDGMELLDRVSGRFPDLPIVMLTAHGTVDLAVQALKRGAFDFLTKPYERAELLAIVKKALAQSAADSRESRPDGRSLVGESGKVQEVLDIIDRVADSPSTVLVRGESGTGKELVAKALHEGSSRSDRPFIKINCAAIPPTLIEAELFGHEKGAFTGAVTQKPGRFELAHTGTLFLDEIG